MSAQTQRFNSKFIKLASILYPLDSKKKVMAVDIPRELYKDFDISVRVYDRFIAVHFDGDPDSISILYDREKHSVHVRYMFDAMDVAYVMEAVGKYDDIAAVEEDLP
ncbi:hypothetical protein J7M00_02480, partial [bacterium]|nr:hypothetical protein [bacterium]